MCIGGDYYSLLKSSADQLNGVQNEFIFRLTAESNRTDGIDFKRREYNSEDIWAFLKNHRDSQGGHRPYIIAFINAPLQSPKLANLFGSHQAKSGLAVVTLHSSAQYVKEERRYCSYYLTRYALSFVNPSIKSHNEPEHKFCYFHRKIDKRDIRESMDSGLLCDECEKNLGPAQGSTEKKISTLERAALKKMRELVSGDYPHAIVMKGGGVKGLAFAGALIEIEKHFWFDRHVGTSAGAITALLLAAEYSPHELGEILSKKNFLDFLDSSWWRLPWNFIRHFGLFPGEHFRLWMAELLANSKKIGSSRVGEIFMEDLNGALLYACRKGSGAIDFDSNGRRKETVAAFAARCSMSIPLFFYPQSVDGRRVYDGGLRNNFPLKTFMESHPGKPYVALYLGKRDDSNQRFMGTELLDIVVDGDERETVDKNLNNVVVIDTSPIGTIDFNLNSTEKRFLLNIGKASALRFLLRKNLDDGPDEAAVLAAEKLAESDRVVIIQQRKRRRRWRIGVFGLLLLGGLLFKYWNTVFNWCHLSWQFW
ncbi:patatin-like phospholipase family protein [Prosthecobacter sp.]|uniref:patatin-like phospholipase family protein n=1 Tax=Prosthecobacter sp. TaxID=1965333 RepID=UPI003783D3B9